MTKSICILGGGTSGLVTALVLKRWYPALEVKIVESSKIGIVGVGEGSTEHWATFMKVANINLKDLITETGATFKSGIKFENWNGDGKFYFHSLHANYTDTIYSGLPATSVALMLNGAEHLTPDSILNSRHYFPLATTVNQYHFDTFKLNTFLHKTATARGVVIVDDDISDVVLDDQGFVSHLVGKDNVQHYADLFVDCSGFARVISSKLGAKWVDCGEYLPMNRAFAFPTPGTNDIPSHTISKALSSGWSWRIPTQERYGNGYVFSDEFITEGQAVDELQQHYDTKIDIGRSFKFSAGYVNKFWIKNCVTLGLAGSFVEPLEATSIGTSIQQALGLGSALLSWDKHNTKVSDQYNIHFEAVAKNIIDFVQLHYLTKRNDSEFWKSCKNLKLTEFNKEMVPFFKNVVPTRMFFNEPHLLFTEQNWMHIMYGLGMFNIDAIKQMWNMHDSTLTDEANALILRSKEFENNNVSLSHRESLAYIMSDKFQ